MLEVIEDRLRGYRDDFHSGGDALFAILDPEEAEVLGGAGLYRRVGPGGIEIGYWVRSDLAGRGIATEATIALTDAGFALEGIDRIEIHCDPRNGASVAIPRKLGYVHIETRPMLDPPGGDPVASTMVWVLTAEEYRRSWT